MYEMADSGTDLSTRPHLWARRRFMAALAGGFLAAPLAAEAQQRGKVWRIGVLSTADGPEWEAFSPRSAHPRVCGRPEYVHRVSVARRQIRESSSPCLGFGEAQSGCHRDCGTPTQTCGTSGNSGHPHRVRDRFWVS